MNKYYEGESKLLVSVDRIVLGFENKKLQLLVGRRKVEPYSGKLSLYGRFVRENESSKKAVNRVLFQYTGINNIYMRQVGVFGETNRDPGDRVISIAYYTLINVSDYDHKLLEENNLQWVDINRLPELYGDHVEMVQIALSQLRKLINKDPLGFNLLPELFTLTRLRNVYETTMGIKIDRRNFRKRIKQIDFIEKTKYIDKITSKCDAALYHINKRTYSDTSL